MILRAAPWRRAPLLLLRSPGVFLACAVAAAVLATAASSGVLFLASTGTAALHNEAAQECPQDAQPAITNDRGPAMEPSALQTPAGLRRSDPVVRTAMRTAGLPDPDLVASADVAVNGDPAATAFLFARRGALSHVAVLRSARGSGVWIPQSYALAHRLRPGSTLLLGTASARVAGVYRDLAPSAFVPLFQLPRYWCNWTQQIVPTPFNRPPPLFLADFRTLESSAATMDATWYVPVPVKRQTVPQARSGLAAADVALAALGPDYRGRSDLRYLLDKAMRERAGLRGPVLPIDVAGTLVAALLVAASGGFWGLRRQRELRLLSSRGVGPAALGVKAVLETAPAVLLGTIAGWLVAIGLVKAFGPSALLEPGAPASALLPAAAAGAAALVAVGIIGARAVPGEQVDGARRRWLRRVPWELALLAASALAYRAVRADGAVRVVKATVQVNPMVLGFPLLALTGAVLLLARGGGRGLSRLGRSAVRLPPAGYLAVRRLTGTPAVALGTLVGVALPVGVLIYSAALTGSTSADVQRKYETNVGAEYAFGTLARPGSTPVTEGHATIVSVVQVDPRLADGAQVQVLGIDPASFPSYAFEGSQLRGLTTRLASRAPGAVAALLVNAPPGLHVSRLQVGLATVPVRVVGARASFPGLRNAYEPMLVVNRAALPPLPPFVDRTEEMWTDSSSVSAALAALSRHGVESNYEITTQTFLNSTGLRPVTWVFGYLRALAYLTGLVALTGLTFAFTARTRRRALSYHLARRMGLSRAGHRRSIALELGGLLALSWTAGAGLAMAAVAAVYRLADAYPAFPPPPSFPVPTLSILTTAVAAVAVAVVGAQLLQWALDRTSASVLLRA